MRRLVPLFAVFVIAVPAFAQEPVPGDTTGRDTTGITQLPQLNVTVTRSPEPLARVPFAVGVLDRDDLVRRLSARGAREPAQENGKDQPGAQRSRPRGGHRGSLAVPDRVGNGEPCNPRKGRKAP